MTLFEDLRYAVRMLERRPGFAVLAVLTLGLGIGATTAIYSVVHPVLFEPLPWPDSERVMTVWQPTGLETMYGRMGFATEQDIAREIRSFEHVAAADFAKLSLTGGGAEPEALTAERVSWTFFRTLGVLPALGRDFLASEDLPNAMPVVVLSHGLWRRRLGGDSTVIGRSITLDGQPVTVVGVMPAGFVDMLQPEAQLWVPLRYGLDSPGACRFCRHLKVVSRLREGATQAQAEGELAALYQRLKRSYANTYFETHFPVVPLQRYMVREVRSVLLLVLAAVGFLLLIACVNVTNLLLGQSVQRRAEFAVRTCLGAARGRLVRQMLTESLLLALLGGGLGVLLANLLVPALLSLSPEGLPRLEAIAVNAPVLLFALALTTAVGVGFGLVPALQVSRDAAVQEMKGVSPRVSGGSRPTRTLLVVGEVALALMLLVGTGLLVQSLRRLFAVAPGMDPGNVLTMQLQTAGPKFATDELTWRYYDQVLAAVRTVPGVESAGLTSQLPLSGDSDQYGVHAEPDPGRSDLELEHPGYRYGVSDGYLETLRIPVLRGRGLTAADRTGSLPVAVIGEAMAKRGWGSRGPMGQRVRIGPSDSGPWYTIVGVVADVLQDRLSAEPDNAIYVPESQMFFADAAMSLVVRTREDPAVMLAALRRVIWSVDREVPIVRVASMSELVARTEAKRRFALILFSAFAAVAIALAGAGIYGVLAASVSERKREIGVRSALGANRSTIVHMVVRQGVLMTALGVGVGLLTAAGLSRTMQSLLFRTSRLDPLTYAGVTVLVLGVALLACWIPAARAARVDPVEALRDSGT